MGNIEELSARVKRLRKAAGLSQAALATHSKLSVQMVKDIEAGRRGGSVETLKKLAEVFGVTLQEISSGSAEVAANIIKAKPLPMSEYLKRGLKIPDSVYEKAFELDDTGHKVWEMVEGFLGAAIKERNNNHKNKKSMA